MSDASRFRPAGAYGLTPEETCRNLYPHLWHPVAIDADDPVAVIGETLKSHCDRCNGDRLTYLNLRGQASHRYFHTPEYLAVPWVPRATMIRDLLAAEREARAAPARRRKRGA